LFTHKQFYVNFHKIFPDCGALIEILEGGMTFMKNVISGLPATTE